MSQFPHTYPVKSLPFRNDIHILRAIAICMVIATHCLYLFDWSHQSFAFHVSDAVLNQGSVIFFFISGFLFQQLSGRFQYKTFLKRKFTTVIVPYILLSAGPIYAYTIMVHRVDLWPWFYTLPIWQQIIMFLLTGKQMAPFWFIPTISIFYLLAPVFIHGDRRNWLYWLIIPSLILSVLLGRDGHYGPINKAIYLFPAYTIGMFYSRYEQTIKKWDMPIMWLTATTTLICVLLMMMRVPIQILAQHQATSLHLVAKLCMTLCYISYFRGRVSVVNPAAKWLADASFGLYFLHGFIIAGIRYAVAGAFTTAGSGLHLVDPIINFAGYSATLVFTVLLASALLMVSRRIFGARSHMVFGY